MTEELSWPLPVAELTDGVVTLRPVRPADAEDIYLSNQDEAMVRFTSVPQNYTRKMAKEFAQDSQTVRWAIQLEEFGERFCGSIKVSLRDESVPSVEVGYSTSPWARGKSAQTRALKLVSNYAFEAGVQRFILKTFLDNIASQKVAERAGFTCEGVERSGGRFKGDLYDLKVYSLLPSD